MGLTQGGRRIGCAYITKKKRMSRQLHFRFPDSLKERRERENGGWELNPIRSSTSWGKNIRRGERTGRK